MHFEYKQQIKLYKLNKIFVAWKEMRIRYREGLITNGAEINFPCPFSIDLKLANNLKTNLTLFQLNK